MENRTIQNSDTIDLRELFQTIAKRKKLIAFITLLFVLLAGLYLYTAKPVYQVKAMIEIGKLQAGTKDETPLDRVGDIKQKLEYIYGVKSKKKRTYPKVKSINTNKQSKSILSIVVEGYSNKEAFQFIETIVQNIETTYKTKVDTFIDTQKELIALTNNDIKTAQENLKQLQDSLKDYNQKIMNLSTQDAALAGIYTIQISQNQERAQELQSSIS
ncbi:MAG: Wzz/FepE/Etk N-terminal domain-containing protein, partial [Campylobacteraceae bacterium]|nr:Wzz/FepE/Etk N-terminal domain-containing protein [Campylobacteraceae bacterium]